MHSMNNSFLTIGITGPTGAGKSTLRALGGEFGFDWLDCDYAARQVVLPGQPALTELAGAFGEDIILPDGTLDRGLLAARAFPTEEGRSRLNAITHPRVLEWLCREAAESFAAGRHAVIDAPLLFEGGVDAMCDVTCAVLAPPEVRLQRIMARDGITPEQARLRMDAQPPDCFYAGRCSYVLHNTGSEEELLACAREMFESIFRRQGA